MTFRRRVVIEQKQASGELLNSFPVFISLTDEQLRHTTHGGHVRDMAGSDVHFLADDGVSMLPYDIETFDGKAGTLQAWVRLHSVSADADTVFYMVYGGNPPQPPAAPAGVWDNLFVTVLRPEGDATAEDESWHAGAHHFDEQLTAEAWVRGDDERAEVLQALVSKWRPRASFESFAGYDAGETDGLNTTGYFGALFDGRYVYFSPELHPDGGHGVVLRYDTQGDFDNPASYEGYDAGNTAGMETRGYYGGVFDGRYVYFVPRHYEGYNHSRLLRYDTHRGFRDPTSWDAFDFGERQTHQSAAYDGRYIYFCPGYREGRESGLSGRVIRYDTRADFHAQASYGRFDAESVDGLEVGCFDGGAFDGRYVYFVPLANSVVLRYDAQMDFDDEASWQAFDANPLGMGMCVGAVFDGRFLYFVPYDNSTVVRYDTEADFYAPDGWSAYDADSTGGLDTRGYDGGFFDGRYVYFVPFVNDKVFHANWLRYDTQQPFDALDAWEAREVPFVDGVNTVGYNGGAFDGRFFYAAPWRGTWGETMAEWDIHGRISRYDTLGSDGTFSLRYCDYGHNGGLCAAVPGPSFLVNTTRGVLSIAAHRALTPGWHYLAGVYDGESLKLYVDGVLAAQREGRGALQTNDAPIVAGRIENGLGQFRGEIRTIRISNVGRSETWIRAVYQNLIRPEGFCRVGAEEAMEGR
ncbi:MAG: DUF2341 domain-containing protein [Candidatus Poribacteria bacterium]|nr:DUF2341 domain-containing protein [Candidatus Poribacteria bacterium]